MTLQEPHNPPIADVDTPDTEVIAVAHPSPVFVDSTGRRRRMLRKVAYGFGALCMVYGGLVSVSLAGGPVSSSAVLPLPDLADDEDDVVVARPSPTPKPVTTRAAAQPVLEALPTRGAPVDRPRETRAVTRAVRPTPRPTTKPAKKPSSAPAKPVESAGTKPGTKPGTSPSPAPSGTVTPPPPVAPPPTGPATGGGGGGGTPTAGSGTGGQGGGGAVTEEPARPQSPVEPRPPALTATAASAAAPADSPPSTAVIRPAVESEPVIEPAAEPRTTARTVREEEAEESAAPDEPEPDTGDGEAP